MVSTKLQRRSSDSFRIDIDSVFRFPTITYHLVDFNGVRIGLSCAIVPKAVRLPLVLSPGDKVADVHSVSAFRNLWLRQTRWLYRQDVQVLHMDLYLPLSLPEVMEIRV